MRRARRRTASQHAGVLLLAAVRECTPNALDLRLAKRERGRRPETVPADNGSASGGEGAALAEGGIDALAAMLASEPGRALYRRHRQTVDSLSGMTGAVFGFTTFSLRGLDSAPAPPPSGEFGHGRSRPCRGKAVSVRRHSGAADRQRRRTGEW